MCVKEFLGYNCGHCSVPTIRQCPLSAFNPIYPICKWPAERPIFTNEFCHPCSRVVWNAKVLKEEEEHRGRHLRGECLCEVIFEGEDREKRLRSRGRKGKSKANEDCGHGEAQGSYEVGEGDGSGSGYMGEEFATGDGGHAAGAEPGGFVGHRIEGDCGGHALAVAEPGGYGGYVEGRHDNEELARMQVVQVEADPPQWEVEAHRAGYKYVGYYHGTGESQGSQATSPVAPSHAMTVYSQGQLAMGQDGAGMKWYPYENNHPAVLSANTYDALSPVSTLKRATSEPIGRYDHHEESAESAAPAEPLVVSSNMMSS